MCELLAAFASQNVDVKLSPSQLIAHGEPCGDPDGWAVAFLDATDAQVWRDPHPTKDNPWVACLGTHLVSTRLALAHIRRLPVVVSVLQIRNLSYLEHRAFNRTRGLRL